MRPIVAASVVTIVAILLIVGLALALASVNSGASEVEGEVLNIVSADGSVSRLNIDIADTQEERTVGLSGREEIPSDYGMLFIIPNPGGGFWMKDTLVPLSVAFIADCGEIVDIQDMQPLSLDLHSTTEDYGFGLEVVQGWFEDNGVAVGDIVSIPRDIRPDGC